jgi:hypothetical protein
MAGAASVAPEAAINVLREMLGIPFFIVALHGLS